MSRTIWKGNIGLSGTSVGVKLQSAAKDLRIHFKLVHGKDHAPVRQELVEPKSGKKYSYSEAKKGLVIAKSRIHVLTEEELQDLEEHPEREISMLCTIPKAEINHIWYDRPYHLVPDEDEKGYELLRKSLLKEDLFALVEWNMRRRQYYGLIVAGTEGLHLYTLHTKDEILQLPDIAEVKSLSNEQEKKLASQLIDALTEDFNLAEYKDTYRLRVKEYVESIASGKTVKLKKIRQKKQTNAIEEALMESLNKVGHG